MYFHGYCSSHTKQCRPGCNSQREWHAYLYHDICDFIRQFRYLWRNVQLDGPRQLYIYVTKPAGKHGRNLYVDGNQSCQRMHFHSYCSGDTERCNPWRHGQRERSADLYYNICYFIRQFWHFRCNLRLDGSRQLHFNSTEPDGQYSRHVYADGYQPCQWM